MFTVVFRRFLVGGVRGGTFVHGGCGGLLVVRARAAVPESLARHRQEHGDGKREADETSGLRP
jgi:hypothetical protein